MATGGNLYPNWLGTASLTIPNNTVTINGAQVNLVPTVVGTNSNKTSWSDANWYTFFTASNVAAGTYLVGCETFADPLTASNAGVGWSQGDYMLLQITDKDGLSTLLPSAFHRPYTEGLQQNATSPYNKGTTDVTTSGILVLGSNTNIIWRALFQKDVATAYPQTRRLNVESPWYQKIA